MAVSITVPAPVTYRFEPETVAIELPDIVKVTGRLLVPEADRVITVPLGLYVMVDGESVKAMD